MSRLDCCPLPPTDRSGGRVQITSPFGPRGSGFHYGCDLGTSDGIEAGTPVHAPADGRIVRYSYDGPYNPARRLHTAGHNIWFRSWDGRCWKMFHLQGPPLVAENQPVTAGTPIARVGASGTVAAHLHLEEHGQDFRSPRDLNASVRDAITSGRWPGHPPASNTHPAPPPGFEENDMAPKPFWRFPPGAGGDQTNMLYVWRVGPYSVVVGNNEDGSPIRNHHYGGHFLQLDGSRGEHVGLFFRMGEMGEVDPHRTVWLGADDRYPGFKEGDLAGPVYDEWHRNSPWVDPY